MVRIVCLVVLTALITILPVNGDRFSSADSGLQGNEPAGFRKFDESKIINPSTQVSSVEGITVSVRSSTRNLQDEVDEFWKTRKGLIDSDEKRLLGKKIQLSNKEQQANKIVLTAKDLEYDSYSKSPETFPPSYSFLRSKELIENSKIFKIIQKFPKGAGLYNLLITSVPLEFLYKLTFKDDLYFRPSGKLQFKFSKSKPDLSWQLLSEARKNSQSKDIEERIRSGLSLLEGNLIFPEILDNYASLTKYKPVFIETFKEVLQTLYNDNVMYADLGHNFPELYDLDGKTYNPSEILKICESVQKEFIQSHTDFIGVKFTYIPLAPVTKDSLKQFREITVELWKSNPQLISGFGILALGENVDPLWQLLEELLKFPKEIKFFLDAGVTHNWGVNADLNLFDAIALNVSVIGDGLAITKHPIVLEELQKRKIAVLVVPIYTQIMKYVKDIRSHPASLLVAYDCPMVIGNAAGTVWNDTGLSYNWYETYMAITPRLCDLRCLKQFALNSLWYSTLSTQEKESAVKKWEKLWDTFIEYVIINYK